MKFEVANGCYNILITNPGGLSNNGEGRWDCQFRHRGLTIEAGHTYRYTYSIWSNKDAKIYCKLGDITDDDLENWHQNGDKLQMDYDESLDDKQLTEKLKSASKTGEKVEFDMGWDSAVPAHIKLNLFTSLGSTLQLFSQLLVIQGFIIIHLELVTVLVPVFQVIIGDVAQLTINLCILVRPDRICITISMTCFDGQTSVTELAVPTTFTVVGQTTRIGDQDVVAAICHFKLHGTSSTFTDMPPQTNTIVKSTSTEFFKTG